MKCNFCKKDYDHDFGTRVWNGALIPLKRCAKCRDYAKNYRKKPDSPCKASEARHNAKPERIASKNRSSNLWRKSVYGKASIKKNKEALNKGNAKWLKTPKGKACLARKNKAKYNKMKSNPHAWLNEKVRLALGNMLRKNMFTGKFSNKIEKFTGFQDEHALMNHFSAQFEEGMNVTNHGNGEGKWTIGHAIPKAYYNSADTEDLKRAWSGNNLFPQWWKQNIDQGCKLPEDSVISRAIEEGWAPAVFKGCVPDVHAKDALYELCRTGKLF